MKRNQIGKFRIGIIDIGDNLDAVAELLKGMVIVKAEFDFGSMAIEYTAISQFFSEVSEEWYLMSEYPYYKVEKDGTSFYLFNSNGERI